MKQEEMNVTVSGESAKHLQMAGRQPSEPEERDALGQIDKPRLVDEPRARAREALGRVGGGDAVTQAAPELGLPGGVGREPVLVLSPRPHHLGAVKRVPVEQVREMPDGAEATSAPPLVVEVAGLPEMSRE